MTAYLNRETEYGWYLCLDGDRIIGGLGVIENDFHDRKDLTPNVCAVYTEEAYRGQGIAGQLLNMVAEDMRSKGISPLYLATDHTGFYEHSVVAKEYETLKLRLWKQFEHNRDAYTDAKTEFISKWTAEARKA